MTKELIENIRAIIVPYMAYDLRRINYENMGEIDAEQFSEDMNEILDLATKVLEQQPSTQSIAEWQKDFREYINMLNIPRDDYKGIMEYINDVPSAQPEILACGEGELDVSDTNTGDTIMKEVFGLIEDILDTLIEVGNGTTDEMLHEAANKLFKVRDLLEATEKGLVLPIKKKWYDMILSGDWIPVSEKLPKYGKEVLTCSNGGFIEIQSLEDGGYWENQKGDWTDFDEVIAWSPLPEPYKPQESEE